MHCLVTLKEGSKPINVSTYDKFVSAEIPDPILEPELHSLVLKYMIHGNPCNTCLVDGLCTKSFPKQLSNETTENENGYPNYKRTLNHTGFIFNKRNYKRKSYK